MGVKISRVIMSIARSSEHRESLWLHGFSTPDSLDAQMKQAMIRIADKSYVLSDSSKFGHNCMVSFAKCSEIFRTLTDSGISAKTLRQFRQHDVDIRVIPANGGSGR